MLQRCFCSDALGWVVDEDLPKEIEELSVEGCVWRDCFLRLMLEGRFREKKRDDFDSRPASSCSSRISVMCVGFRC